METKFEKFYIGNAKTANEEFSIVSVSVCIDDAEPHFFEYKGKRYLKFEVAPRKAADDYGNTHTVYLNKKVNSETKAEPETKKPKAEKAK